jgi:hypothetical protein
LRFQMRVGPLLPGLDFHFSWEAAHQKKQTADNIAGTREERRKWNAVAGRCVL